MACPLRQGRFMRRWTVVKQLARALGGDLTVVGSGPEGMSVSLTIANQGSGAGSANHPDSLEMIRDLSQAADLLQTETRQAPGQGMP